MVQSDSSGFRRIEDDALRGQGFRSATGGRDDVQSTGPEGLGTLISGLIKDIQDLVRGEITLARTELKEEASAMSRALMLLAVGALIGLIALAFIALTASAVLDMWMTTWIAVGVVALTLAILAGIFALTGKSKLSASKLKPQQTLDSLKEDQEWAKQQMKSVRG